MMQLMMQASFLFLSTFSIINACINPPNNCEFYHYPTKVFCKSALRHSAQETCLFTPAIHVKKYIILAPEVTQIILVFTNAISDRLIGNTCFFPCPKYTSYCNY